MLMPYINHIESTREFKNLFLQQDAEVRVAPTEKEEVYGYWATSGVLPKGTLYFPSFMNDILPKDQGISPDQATILSYAHKIFEGSRPLSEFEGKVLDQTLYRLGKRIPTRPNRK